MSWYSMGSPPFCTLIFCSVVFWTFFCEKSMNFQFGISYESNTSFFLAAFNVLSLFLVLSNSTVIGTWVCFSLYVTCRCLPCFWSLFFLLQSLGNFSVFFPHSLFFSLWDSCYMYTRPFSTTPGTLFLFFQYFFCVSDQFCLPVYSFAIFNVPLSTSVNTSDIFQLQIFH